MIDDGRQRAPREGGDALWIESLGMSADENTVIRHSLDMADAVMRQEDPTSRTGAGGGRVPDAAAESESVRAEVVREGPSIPASERAEPYVQPRPV